jgi:dienelactone hydrolase
MFKRISVALRKVRPTSVDMYESVRGGCARGGEVAIGRRAALSGIAGAALGLGARGAEAALVRGACGTAELAGFEAYCFTDDQQVPHRIYVAEGGGPPVILLHELPGLVDDDLTAAKRLANERFTVVAPLLFGEPGGDGHAIRYARRMCGKEQFACNAGRMTSPHLRWLRQLVSEVRARWPQGTGVGVVGMCLTGAFPLAMLTESAVVAPVLLQPTIPFNIWTRFGWFTDTAALGISDADLLHAKTKRDTPILGIRYRGDWRCRKRRFERLVDEFSSRFYRLDLPGDGHSTIGKSCCEDAFLEVAAFLAHQLTAARDRSRPGVPPAGSRRRARRRGRAALQRVRASLIDRGGSMLKRVSGVLFEAPAGAEVQIVARSQDNNGVQDARFEYADTVLERESIQELPGCRFTVQPGRERLQAIVVFHPEASRTARYDLFEVEPDGGLTDLEEMVEKLDSAPLIGFVIRGMEVPAVAGPFAMTRAAGPRPAARPRRRRSAKRTVKRSSATKSQKAKSRKTTNRKTTSRKSKRARASSRRTQTAAKSKASRPRAKKAASGKRGGARKRT